MKRIDLIKTIESLAAFWSGMEGITTGIEILKPGNASQCRVIEKSKSILHERSFGFSVRTIRANKVLANNLAIDRQ